MAERDYKVTYKTRLLDKDEERPRIPTALDPYDNPYSGGLPHRRRFDPRNSSSTIDDSSSATEVARSTTRTAYSARNDDRLEDKYVDSSKSARDIEPPPPRDDRRRRSAVMDQRWDDPPARRSDQAVEPRRGRDAGYTDVDGDKFRARGRDYYVDDRPRPTGVPYVIETRRGNVIDVSTASGSKVYSGDRDSQRYAYHEPQPSRNKIYDRDYGRKLSTRAVDEPRGGNVIVLDNGYLPALSRSQYNDQRPLQMPSRGGYEYDREEDWRLVDSMRGTRIDSPASRDDYTERHSRSRAETYSSEDSFVIVSPTQASTPRHRERSVSRSAIRRTDYPEPEIHRRRSRSISFRGSQISYHDSSERRHERPGAEAQILGEYMRRPPASDYDDASGVDTYASYNELDRRGGANTDRFASTYRERDEPYGPQVGYEPQDKRSRSRRRRREDTDNDDRSYYSENVVKKTTRETRYE